MTKRDFTEYKYLCMYFTASGMQYLITKNEETAKEFAVKHGCFYIKAKVYAPKRGKTK